MPRNEFEQVFAPGEWLAWIGLAFSTSLLGAVAASADAFATHVPIALNPAAAGAGRDIAALLVAWLLVAWLLRRRWRGTVLEDERDVQIARRAGDWGRGATVAAVIGVALLLGFSPTTRLQQFSYPWLAQLLMAALLLGAWFDHAVAAWLYWRDRDGAMA